MFLLPAVLVGVAVGLALGGRLGRLGDVRVRAAWLFYAALGLQLMAFPSALNHHVLSDRAAVSLWLVSYACLVAVTLLNRHMRGLVVAGLGMGSNLVAVIANGGHMPALPGALRDAGLAYTGVHMNSVAATSPNLPWLVDRWAAPGWVPWGNVYSVGDVLIAAGVVIVVACAMGARIRPDRGVEAGSRGGGSGTASEPQAAPSPQPSRPGRVGV